MPIYLFLLSFFISISAFSAPDKINTLLQQLPTAQVGIYIEDLDTHHVINQINAEQLFTPASGTKLFTAAAALFQLQPDFRFETTLSQKNNDYYLTFTGNPAFTTDNLKTLIQPLLKGDKTLKGNIIIDESYFASPHIPGGTSYDDLGWYYAAPASALILDGNAVAYDFITSEKLGGRVEVKPKLNTPSPLRLYAHIKTVTLDTERNHCPLHIQVYPHNTLSLYGCLAQSKDPVSMKLAILDTFLYAEALIQAELKAAGITFQGKILKGKTPKDAKVLLQLYSDDLKTLIKHMLETSDNVYAAALTQTLGQVVMHEGSMEQGAFAIKKILGQTTPLKMDALQIKDGVGTRYNLISPHQIVSLLASLYRNPKLKPILMKSLPKMGESGSLKERGKNTPLQGQVMAKTGTMNDTSSLSGYLIAPNTHVYAFSIIFNHVLNPKVKPNQSNIAIAKTLEEQILLGIRST